MGLISGLKPVHTSEASVTLKASDGTRTKKLHVIIPPGTVDPSELAGLFAEQLAGTAVDVTAKVGSGKDGGATATVNHGRFPAESVALNWLRDVSGDEDATLKAGRKAGKRRPDAPVVPENGKPAETVPA